MLYHQNRQGWLSLALALCLGLSLFLLPAAGITLAAEETYVVQSGDNLTSIAAKYNVTVQAITKANGIVNPSLIYKGQKLIIPTGETGSQTAANAAPTTGEQGYIVQRGDTLYGIAKKFAVPVTELAKVNGLSLMDYIYSGQSLKIPASGGAPVQIPATAAPVVVAPTPTALATTANAAPTSTAGPLVTPTPIVVMPTATAIPTEGAVIPATPTGAAANQPTVVSTAAAFGGTYVVQAGDTLSGIAGRYGTTVEVIAKANGITNPSQISVGQKLTIPGTAPGQLAAPVPTKASSQPELPAQPAANPAASGKWIDVNLSKQRLTAYVGSEAVFTSLVSTGLSGTPTPVGTFNIYIKYQSQAMSGGSGRSYYYLPNVPYVLYFYESYALHGTYWHSNFGHPMSHGCVNLPTPAAQFIYNWAPMGTPVKIHY